MNSKKHLIKTPSAWLPLVMSSSAFVLLISYIIMFGVTKQQDEGTAARIFHLLLVGQIPIIIFFTIKWLPKKRKQVLQILTLQFFAGLLAFATVFFLEL